ncbi:conserved hypothetical protein [Candidatus Sulfopaludibacter sp. SbA6]|nr:conserved hypothetical protein [Candidatus Sulfopaludibacter sp. SbA6]
MPTRSSRRLAGSIVIELLLAAGVPAADLEYKAGGAAAGQAKGLVRALVLEDRRGNRAAIVEARFAIPRAVSDFAGARLLESYGLDRAGVLLRGVSAAPPQTDDLFTAVAAALGKLEPAAVRYGNGALSVTSADGRCVAALQLDASLTFDRCGAGGLVHGSIRSAFQFVEPAHGLLQRDAAIFSYPVQAIAIGKQVTILALGGEVPAGRFRAKGLMVASFANDAAPLPDTPEIDAAIRQVLARVR